MSRTEVRESQRLKIAGHPLAWETGNGALYSAHGHCLPGYPDEIVELARQQVNDGLNHFAVVSRSGQSTRRAAVVSRLAPVELIGFSSITERCPRGWMMPHGAAAQSTWT
jgi:hypothetical protein